MALDLSLATAEATMELAEERIGGRPSPNCLPPARIAMRALPQVCPCAVAFLLFGALATALAEGPALMEPVFTAEQVEIFEQEIRPLLIEHCHKCHSDREEKGNLRLDSRAALLKGGD